MKSTRKLSNSANGMGWRMIYSMNKDILAKLVSLRKFTQNKCAEDNNMSMKNKDEDISVVEYRNIIREMIKNENDIRNQRTNWFLVLQGFLVAAICNKHIGESNLCCLIAGIGIVTSYSFWHAAWRSKLAISFALACWEEKLNYEQRIGLPPVSLIVRDILKAKEPQTESNKWELEIKKRMFSDGKGKLSWWEKIRNNFDCILPYMALPKFFFFFWIIFLLYDQLAWLFKNIYELIASKLVMLF